MKILDLITWLIAVYTRQGNINVFIGAGDDRDDINMDREHLLVRNEELHVVLPREEDWREGRRFG